MMMKVKVTSSSMVKPAKETPTQSVWLTSLDLMFRTPYSHTPCVYLFRPGYGFFDADVIKKALSQALVYFYPLAGRLKKNEEDGRLEIDCNADEGVPFLVAEAESPPKLGDLGDYFTPSPEIREALVPTCDYSGGISSFPLLIVQFTRFQCGGVGLGIATQHQVVDGNSAAHFTKLWSDLVKGVAVTNLTALPFLDRTVLKARNPPLIKFDHIEFQNTNNNNNNNNDLCTKVSVFELSSDYIKTLHLKMAPSQEGTATKLSTFHALAGHIWRSACKARCLPDDQEVKFFFFSNGRQTLKTVLPEGYFGNAAFPGACVAKTGEIVGNPTRYAACIVQEAMKKMYDEEYLRSALDYMETHYVRTSKVRDMGINSCPNLLLNSWTKLTLHDIDFGWGTPTFVGRAEIPYEGLSSLLQSPRRDGSLLLAINLYAHHMELFQKFLYDFND